MKYQSRTAMTLVLASLAMLASQSSIAQESSADIGDFNFTGDAVVLPLVKNSTHPKVVFDIGDGEHYEFIVDTGAGVNVIDSSIAEAQGYEVVGEMAIGAPGGKQVPGKIVRVPVIRVGDATIENAEFVTMDIIGLSGGIAQGVIGIGVFSDYLVAYDIRAGQITISKGSLSADEPGVIAYDGSNKQIEIEVDVAGTMVATHIDTGSMGGLMLPGELAESLPLIEAPVSGRKARMVGGERDIAFAELDGSIQFAGLKYENLKIAFMSPSTGSGNIGGRILDQLVVSIDQQNHLIGFKKTLHDKTVATSDKRRRLGIQFSGMSNMDALTIGRVDAGSLGEKAGLLPGDKLLTINDKPADEYGMPALGALFGGSEPLSIEVDRDGETQTVEIQ
jgi:predicted aspartyl protease